jgi:hypothetical protein
MVPEAYQNIQYCKESHDLSLQDDYTDVVTEYVLEVWSMLEG